MKINGWTIFFVIWMIVVTLLLMELVNGETITYSINSTVNSTNQSIKLDILGFNYIFDTGINTTQQTNMTIQFPEKVNITYFFNQTNITFNCPQPQGYVNISNNSIQIIESILNTRLDQNSEQIKAKISDDILFHLTPTQQEIDELNDKLISCRKNSTEHQLVRYNAELQQEKWFLENEGCKKDNQTLTYITIGMFFMIIFVVIWTVSGGNIKRPKINF